MSQAATSAEKGGLVGPLGKAEQNHGLQAAADEAQTEKSSFSTGL